MPDRPRISTSQRSTAAVIEQQHDVQGLVITQPNTFSESSIAQSNTLSESSIAQSIDPLLIDLGETCKEQTVTSVTQSEAVQSLNEEVIANTQRKVIAMEKKYNKVWFSLTNVFLGLTAHGLVSDHAIKDVSPRAGVHIYLTPKLNSHLPTSSLQPWAE